MSASTYDGNLQQYPFTYSEVQQLIDEAWLKGWTEGMDKGYKAGKKRGAEESWEKVKKGQLEWYELGIQHGKEEEQWKWLAEGHSAGLHLLMAAHVHALLHGTVLLEKAETQTDNATIVNVNTQTAATTWNNASTD
jgi:hypothetical protein